MLVKKILLKNGLLGFIILMNLNSNAQQAIFEDTLLNHLQGKWVLTGAIAKKQTTHDITAEWVDGHQYLRIHEISRERNTKGIATYEADVFIGWQQATGKYVCIWLDDYGGMNDESLGTAVKNSDNQIPFIFTGTDGIFHTTFKYFPLSDTWNWNMQSESKGVFEPFADVLLKRAAAIVN